MRIATLALTAVLLLDVVIAGALHVVLAPVDRDRSLLAAWFRLTYSVFLGGGIVALHLALSLTTDPASALVAAQRQETVLLALRVFDTAWMVGLAAFGCHLVLVGGLLVRSRTAPPSMGVALVVAGGAYLVDTGLHPGLDDDGRWADLRLVVVTVPSVLGELALATWLLVRAGREPGDGRAAKGSGSCAAAAPQRPPP